MPATYGTPKYGTTTYGPPLQDPLPAKPLLAKLYDFQGNFIKSLGPILDRPKLAWTLNGGGHPVEILLPANDTSATAPVPGNQIKLLEDGGDGSLVWGGLIQKIEDDIDTRVRHALQCDPYVVELGYTPFSKNYAVATDVAQMVRDAVAATDHLYTTATSCPNSGYTAVNNFLDRFSLDVVEFARHNAGVNCWHFVDASGCVWFQAQDLTRSVYSVLLERDVSVRKSTTGNDVRQNFLIVKGGVPPNGTVPLTSIYSGSSRTTIGTRAAQQVYTFPTVTDQATLDQIKATLGAVFDRQLTRLSLRVPKAALPGPIMLGQVGGATLRYQEPAVLPMVESFTGSGLWQGPYCVLEVEDDGEDWTFVTGDVPITSIDDFAGTVHRAIQRTILDPLFNTAMSGTQVQTLAGGGYQTAPDPAPGIAAARIKADGSAIRGFDSTLTDYGLPEGPGETFRFGVDGIAYLAKLLLQSSKTGARIVFDTKTDPANPLITVYDTTPVARAQMGSLAANGISPAQFGFRANDASGNPIFDSLGLIAVMKRIANAYSSTSSLVTGPATGSAVVSAPFTLTRALTVLSVYALTANLQTGSTGLAYMDAAMDNADGGSNTRNHHVAVFNSSTYITSTWIRVDTLAAGSHTAALWVDVDASSTLNPFTAALDVFLLGS